MSRRYPCIYCTEDLHCTKYSDDDCESWCVLGPCTAETPSNGDKIRQMTDEELADFIARQRFSAVNPIADKLGIDVTTAFIIGRKNVLDWLKREVEE